MANIANSNGFRPVVALAGQGFVAFSGLARSNSLISTGDALYASAGYIRPTSAATTDKMILGVAITPITASVTRRVSMLYYPAVDWIVYEGQASGTFTQAKVYTCCDVEGSSRGKQEVNEDGATNKQMMIVGYNPNTSIGAYSRVWFIWARSKFTAKFPITSVAMYAGK